MPKGPPTDPRTNHLAVPTEDHPLEYATFEGEIPKGEYGGGKVVIWDSGRYEAEKFNTAAQKGGEVIVDLYGQRITGRYALIQTKGDQWLAHRMKEQPQPRLQDYAPMLATLGTPPQGTGRAVEVKADGQRGTIVVADGAVTVFSRNGTDVTRTFPELSGIAAAIGDRRVVLDGEIVALDAQGRPSFTRLQRRWPQQRRPGADLVRSVPVRFWAFDILRLDGRSLLRAKYRDRRKVLETLSEGGDLIVPPLLDGDGPAALEFSRKKKWEGVVAKKWDSTYQPGRRSSSWIKDKNWNTQEIVIGGWRQGNGWRSSGIGALLMGIPGGHGLQFVGRVGTGFSDKELGKLKKILEPLHTDDSPFDPPLPRAETKGVTYVRPDLVGEVRYGERSRIDWLLQHPQRPDCYVEVKSVTAVDEHDLALFPDAVSARGARHMHELAAMAAQGARAVVLFCVQRGDALALRAADEIDPAYGRALRDALARGVEAYAYRAAVDTRGITLVRRIPVLP